MMHDKTVVGPKSADQYGGVVAVASEGCVVGELLLLRHENHVSCSKPRLRPLSQVDGRTSLKWLGFENVFLPCLPAPCTVAGQGVQSTWTTLLLRYSTSTRCNTVLCGMVPSYGLGAASVCPYTHTALRQHSHGSLV